MSEYCCEELKNFRSVNDNVRIVTHDQRTGTTIEQTFKHKWNFKFCPFCGEKL